MQLCFLNPATFLLVDCQRMSTHQATTRWHAVPLEPADFEGISYSNAVRKQAHKQHLPVCYYDADDLTLMVKLRT